MNRTIAHQACIGLFATIGIFAQPAHALTYQQIADETSTVVNISTAADVLKAKLQHEVDKILAHGQLLPFRAVYGEEVRGASGGAPYHSHWFFEPWQMMFTLGRAYPYVSVPAQAGIRAYVRREIQRVAPWGTNKLDMTGTPRQPERPTVVAHDYNDISYKRRGDAFHALWVYGSASGDWTDIQANWTTIKSAYTTVRGQQRTYQLIAGAIAMYRMAKQFGDTAAAASYLADINTFMAEGLNFETYRANAFTDYSGQSYYVRGSGGLPYPLYSLTPEVARYMRDNPSLLAAVTTYVERMPQQGQQDYSSNPDLGPMNGAFHPEPPAWVWPLWWMAECPVGDWGTFGETKNGPPTLRQLFNYFAWVRNDPPDRMAYYVDVADALLGDCYYIQNLVTAIEQYGTRVWGSGGDTIRINGYVRDVSSNAIAAVTMTLSGGDSRTTTTDTNGYYEFSLLTTSRTYTITPSKTGYVFSPASRTLTNVTSDQTGVNFVGSMTVSNQPPTVNLTSPVNGSTYTAPATVTLAATASDSDGSIARVEFWTGSTLLNADTASPYAYSWAGVAAGSYALRAIAYDNQNATSTSTLVNITVYSSGTPANQPPVVSLTGPVNGSTYTAPTNITLSATANDPDGTISAVRFYSGTTLLNLDSASPYTYTWTGVSSGTYQLYATATDNQGAVSTSSVVNVTVYVPAPDTTPPSVPTNLALVSKSSVAALISWAASTDNVGVTGYRVYRNGVTVGTAAAIMYLDIGLTPATTYQYTVAAYDAAGNQSAQSAPLSVVTDPPGGTSDTTPPSVPQNLRLVARTTGSISIAWDASTDNVGVTGYSVFRGTVMAAFVTGTSHTDTGLAPGTTYVYTVTAMDAALNYSAASLPLIAATEAFVPDTTPPTVPQNLRLVSRTSSTVSIAWDASTDNVGVAGYRVYRDGNVVYDGAGTGFTDTGLSAGTTYTYRVSAYDAAGNQSAQSAPLSAVTSAAGTPSQESVSGEVRVAGGVDGYINPRAGDRVRVEFGRVVSAGEMTVRVYSLSGALVRTLTAAGGVSRVEWDATTEDGGEVPSGIYILHVKGPALDRRFRVAVVR